MEAGMFYICFFQASLLEALQLSRHMLLWPFGSHDYRPLHRPREPPQTRGAVAIYSTGTALGVVCRAAACYVVGGPSRVPRPTARGDRVPYAFAERIAQRDIQRTFI